MAFVHTTISRSLWDDGRSGLTFPFTGPSDAASESRCILIGLNIQWLCVNRKAKWGKERSREKNAEAAVRKAPPRYHSFSIVSSIVRFFAIGAHALLSDAKITVQQQGQLIENRPPQGGLEEGDRTRAAKGRKRLPATGYFPIIFFNYILSSTILQFEKKEHDGIADRAT
jgi:hypothetical protein